MTTRALVRGALAGACIAGAAISAITYVSQRRLMDEFRTFEAHPSIARSLDALRASDWVLNPSVYRDEAIADGLLHTGRPVEAERYMVASVDRQPGNVLAWYALARIQVARGRLGAARASYARARELNPHLPPGLPPSF